MLVAPFLHPANGKGDTPPLPYYLYVSLPSLRRHRALPLTCLFVRVPDTGRYCLVGIAVMAVGVLYWAAWRIVPRWFGVEYVPRKEVLADGTVVTLVRSSFGAGERS